MDVQNIARILDLYLPEPNLSLIKGVLFGININSSGYFYDQLKITGLLHLVVASGTNISILIAIIGLFCIQFGRKTSVLISVIFIVFYIYLIGPQAPNIRAAIMGILTLVGILYGRENIAIFGIFISIIFISVFYPKWLTSVSLYLSYGATVGMLVFGKGSDNGNFLQRELSTTLSAQVFTAPIIFIYFQQVSLISPIANIMVSFLIPPLMIFGFLTVIFANVNYYLGSMFAFICYGLTEYVVIVVGYLAKLPGIYFNLHG